MPCASRSRHSSSTTNTTGEMSDPSAFLCCYRECGTYRHAVQAPQVRPDMITRATILPGDAASPVVLHVPYCPPMPAEITPRMLLDGTLDSIADRIAQNARKQATRRPHVVLNRLPSYLDDVLLTEPRDGYRQICTHHDAALTADPPTSYLTLVRNIVDERIGETGRALVIQIWATGQDAVTGGHPRVRVGADPEVTPPTLIDTVATAFAAYDVAEYEESAPVRHDGVPRAMITAMTIDFRLASIGDVAQEEILGLSRGLAALVDADLADHSAGACARMIRPC